ncbi:hypothetical protein [Stenotrophomonas sp. PS02289]|uniref:hypothetical protein n=1 Tax=Stenotrophomonas sp. PS02289 TaxID=2991422 RepID=UPI00249B9193|nr:hypothetical protein [Stenotrophomonas sp. PS02289]
MRTLLLAAALVAFGSSSATADDAPAEVLFVADPQIHNMYGVGLKQMMLVSDLVSNVAIRHPEVNIAAPLTLRYALQQGQARLARGKGMVVVLGDGTNIGCTGGAEAFKAEFDRLAQGSIWLQAHGNHDSYLIGTVNSYRPVEANELELTGTMQSPLPVDESAWKPSSLENLSNWNRYMRWRNWPDACYRPSVGGYPAGTPMNKIRWLARYTKYLEKHGLILEPAGTSEGGGIAFTGTADSGKALHLMNYQLHGIWYRPKAATFSTLEEYQEGWKSFIVQRADIGATHTLVLIDTSVCPSANGGLTKYWGSNAGTNGCLGTEQLSEISAMVGSIPKERSIIVGGHFPLVALEEAESRSLSRILEQARPSGWTYVSGHTHNSLSGSIFGNGVDINIGSTTDWPLESHVMRFSPNSARVVEMDSTVIGNPPRVLKYKPDRHSLGKRSELCRHYKVAEVLAEARSEEHRNYWRSPSISWRECNRIEKNWKSSAEELIGFQQRISNRFDEPDGLYRDFILSIAAGASYEEFTSFSIGKKAEDKWRKFARPRPASIVTIPGAPD